MKPSKVTIQDNFPNPTLKDNQPTSAVSDLLCQLS